MDVLVVMQEFQGLVHPRHLVKGTLKYLERFSGCELLDVLFLHPVEDSSGIVDHLVAPHQVDGSQGVGYEIFGDGQGCFHRLTTDFCRWNVPNV